MRPATTSSRRCARWEAETQPAADAGVRTVHTRTGIVLAAHGGALARMLLPFKLGLGGKQGSGKQWMSWIALDDEVGRDPVPRSTTRGSAGPVNLVAPNPVTNAEFADALGHAVHRPTVLPTPMFPLSCATEPSSYDSLLLVSQRVLPTELERIDFQFRYPVLGAALQAMLA